MKEDRRRIVGKQQPTEYDKADHYAGDGESGSGLIPQASDLGTQNG